MNPEINKRENILLIIQQHIEDEISEGIDNRLSELNEPDGSVIWECILRVFEKAEIPDSERDGIREYVQESMHKEGFKFILG